MKTENLQNIIDFTKEVMSGYDSSHDFSHVERVLDTVSIIVRNELENDNAILAMGFSNAAAIDIITVAGCVHDVIDHKYHKDPKEIEQRLRKVLIEEIPKYANEIMKIIDNISFSKEIREGYPQLGRLQLLRDILSDADKLDAIGKQGAYRCETYTRAIHPNMNERELLLEQLKHYDEKLLRLFPEFIRTTKGKHLGEMRHREMLEIKQERILRLEQTE